MENSGPILAEKAMTGLDGTGLDAGRRATAIFVRRPSRFHAIFPPETFRIMEEAGTLVVPFKGRFGPNSVIMVDFVNSSRFVSLVPESCIMLIGNS
jgi:hypothetical protein